MREMCSEGFESPSPLSYRDEVGNDNHNHTSLTREGWKHLLIRDDKALSSAIADKPEERRNQFHRSSPGDQLHVQSPRLPMTTSTAHYASGKQTDHDLEKLVSFTSMQICTDRNVGTVTSGNSLSPSNGFIDRKPDEGSSSSELSVDSTSNRLPMLTQERPTAPQQSPDPPPPPRQFKAQEDVYEMSIFVPNSTADIDDGFEWLLLWTKTDNRSYFKCAVHGCHVPLHLSSLRIHHHLLDSSRLKKMCMKCQFLYPIQQQTSTMALNGSFYGRKQITGAMNPNPRSYFKCAVHGCHAKKWTQSSSQMPGSIYLSHSGRHSHSLRSSNQLDSQDAHNLLWP
ncbi:hypothetical protein KP509_1Z140100 [Ceratopteris richardii]|nr:hypothetical protein KP509_1Z140100 [Ceratopteris richardii]